MAMPHEVDVERNILYGQKRADTFKSGHDRGPTLIGFFAKVIRIEGLYDRAPNSPDTPERNLR